MELNGIVWEELKIKTVLLFILWTRFLIIHTITHPLSQRFAPLEDFQSNVILQGTTLKVLRGLTKNQCAVSCQNHPQCLSFNFCEPLLCSLLPEDVFSAPEKLQQKKQCIYQGMNLNVAPFCTEMGPGKCDQEGKMRCAQWGQWNDHLEVDSPDERKKVELRVWNTKV